MCAVERKTALQRISICMLLDLLCTVKKPLSSLIIPCSCALVFLISTFSAHVCSSLIWYFTSALSEPAAMKYKSQDNPCI